MWYLIKRAAVAVAGLVWLSGMAGAAEATAPAAKPAPVAEAGVDVEQSYTGKVQVTKNGDKVTAINLVIDAQTTYAVKLNPNGLKLAPFDGKAVVVKGIMRKVDGALLLTARDVKDAPVADAKK